MKTKIYDVSDGKRELVFEEEFDSADNKIYFKDYREKDVIEKYCRYNSDDLLEFEREVVNGIEIDRREIKFTDGKEMEHLHFLSGELYQKVIVVIDGEQVTKYTYQDDEEVERSVTINLNETDYITEFFQGDDLIETQEFKFNKHTNTSATDIYDPKKEFQLIRKKTYDDKERVVEFQEYNENNNLLEEYRTLYEGDLLKRIEHRYFHGYAHENQSESSYDNNGNQVRLEVKDGTGNLLEFCNTHYNEEGKKIAEDGYSLGNAHPIYGLSETNPGFQIEIEYED